MTPTHKQASTIIFGAFDRHNLGDLLFPHIAARLLGERPHRFAGLAERDLRHWGGHQTRAISQLACELRSEPVILLHAGGEVLDCDAWQAAVMVQAPDKVQPIIRQLEGGGGVQERWIREALGLKALAPYVASRELFPQAQRIVYTAIGGVELPLRDDAFRNEVVTKLRQADYVGVREQQTLAYLAECGIDAQLMPDPVVVLAELFGMEIEQLAYAGEVAAIRSSFPRGYLACQFSGDFGDDATLRRLAMQLEAVALAHDYAIVLFRAGAAPWHDDLESYQRLAGLIHRVPVKLFTSLNIWDICALLAQSCGFCGSSLHGRIVAMAYGLPRLNITHPHQSSRTGKQAAYAATWELPGLPHTVEIEGLAIGMEVAIAADHERLHNHARTLAAKYLEAFTTILSLVADPR